MPQSLQFLLLAWITYVLTHPKGAVPYPILVILGEQGTGKSFLAKLLRALIDANDAAVSMLPRNIQDLAIAAQHSYLLVFDNIRDIPTYLSDMLCILATGGTVGTRRLYTNAEQVLLNVHAPILLNGIHPFVREPDLADRTISVQLLALDLGNRREEGLLKDELEKQLPRIFRGILALAAKILAKESKAKITHPTRMLTFTRWLAAFEQVLGKAPGELQALYADSLKDAARDEALDDPITAAVIALVESLGAGHWMGTPTELLAQLAQLIAGSSYFTPNDLPSNAISLSRQLRTRTSRLRSLGVSVSFLRADERQIRVSRLPSGND